MPTGYTAYIEDGDITTGKEFLKLCTRAFGIAMSVRDDPLSVETPIRFEPNTYYYEQYLNALNDLNIAEKMTIESAKIEMQKSHSKTIANALQMLEKSKLINERYYKIRQEVESWEPPTEDHFGIKKFALEQIDMCIIPESEINEYRKQSESVLNDSDEEAKAYIEDHIEFCRSMADSYKKNWQQVLMDVEKKNRFMDQFIKSLENIEDKNNADKEGQ